MMTATQMRIKSQRGIPQQRREGFRCFSPASPWSEWEFRVSMLCNVERRKKMGQDERPSAFRGGGGKDARVSCRDPELRWRSLSGQLNGVNVVVGSHLLHGGIRESLLLLRLSLRLAVLP